MKALIIEDEKAAVRNLMALLGEVDPDIEVIDVLDSITDSVEWFQSHPMPELIFLDIHLADGSAFEIFGHVDISCPIIFTTAYDEYALKAFKVNSVDYLLKPIDADDIRKALDKLSRLQSTAVEKEAIDYSAVMQALKRVEGYKTHFLIPMKGDKLLPVSVDMILFFYIADGNVKAVMTDGKEYLFTQPLYVSDRRWKKMVKLLKASAFLNGSDTIRLSDCTLLSYCLWSEMDQMEAAEEMVNAAIQKSAEGYLLNIKGLEQDMEELKDRQSSEHSLREVNDPGIQVIDTYYYQVEGVRMKERLLIFAADYQHLDQTGKLFYLHKDKYKANCCILKKYDSILHAKVPRNKIYTLKKGLRSIYINNYEYHLMCYEDCPPPPPEPEPEDFGAKYKSVAEALDRVEKDWSGLLDAETEYYEKHLFLSERQRASMRRMLRHQKNTIDRYKNDLNEMADAYRKENQEYKVERSEDDLFSGTER